MSRILNRRQLRRANSAIIVVLAILLAGCASRPGPEVLVPVATAPGSKEQQIYVATTRMRASPSENVFTTERANTLNFAKFVIAVPPNHQPGRIEWPQSAPDARVSFVTRNQAVLTKAEFRDAVAPSRKSSRRDRKHDVLIFVHGYNNNFQESLYRLAQIGADSGFNGIPILFAWPSQGQAVKYDTDKVAAVYSREYFIKLLRLLASSPKVGEIMIVAHSMGGMLTVEALRELRVQHQDRVIARLGRVILAAPDIDIADFRSQVQTIGPLNPPLTVLVSTDDKALKLSSFIGGSIVRAGALDVDNPLLQDAATKAKVRIIDISQLRSPDGGMNHDRLFQVAAYYSKLQSQSVAERKRFGTFRFDAANVKQIEANKPAPAAAE